MKRWLPCSDWNKLGATSSERNYIAYQTQNTNPLMFYSQLVSKKIITPLSKNKNKIIVELRWNLSSKVSFETQTNVVKKIYI